MTSLESITIIIPALNPDNKLIDLVQKLKASSFQEIVIVNDGSTHSCSSIFEILKNSCTILEHPVNLGKGRALKTAFSYFLQKHKSSPGVITVDSDGQHDIEDIKKVASEMISKPDSLILGVRQFNGGKIPFRSRFGNQLTKKVLALASGLRLSDTQTGLRGIPSPFLQQLLDVKGDRFEYEMNMLLQCKPNKVSIQEVSIQTIYIEENRSSHFQPVKDSLKIYSVFFKYSISSLSSFGIDIILFYFLSHFLKGMFPHTFIVLATIGARILSALFNYSMNRNAVFHLHNKSTMSKYFVLVIAQMLFSGFASTLFYYVLGKKGEVLIKIAVDTILFFGSYSIQKKWVFASKIKARPIS